MPPVVLASSVRAVTVYRRGALVTREAELVGSSPLPDELLLEGLPLTLDDSSLRLEIVASAVVDAATLPVAGDLRVTIAVPGHDPSLPPPDDDELEQAEHELRKLQRELQDTRDALVRVNRLTPASRGAAEEGKPPQLSPTLARLELLGFRRDRGQQLSDRIAELSERERLARVRRDTLQERRRVASSARNVRTHELRKAALVKLEPRAGSVPERLLVRLHYFVPGARWAPAYTIRLGRELDDGTIELRALVGQQSGEDWKNVALTLSTASPQQWTELPELAALKIGRAQPEPAKTGWRPPPIGTAELYADYDRELGDRQPPMPRRSPALPAKPVPAPASVSEAPFELQSLTRAGVLREEAEGAYLADDEVEQAKSRARRTSAPPRAAAPPPPSMPPPPGGFAGPPRGAPPPMAAPAPQQSYAMPVEPARKGGLGIGGALGAVAGGVASMFDGGGGGMDEDDLYLDEDKPADEPAPPGVVAGRDLLDYGRLRLFGPEHRAQRGSLRRIDRRMLYQQLSVTTIAIDEALTFVDRSASAAHQFEQRGAPERHRFPEREAGFDYAYLADAPIDLASDGQYHAIALRSDRAEATPRYVAVPRESQDVFRIVALRNPLQAPLLPGPADVYVGGRFQVSSDLSLTPIGGRIELGLGVEQAIKIARNVKYSEDTSGMFKRSLALLHELELKVANNLGRPASVEIRERLPVVPEGVDDVQIQVREVSPQWQDFEQKQAPLEGGRMWKIEVPAKTERELKASFVITIPTQHELIGGNRRES